VAAGVDPVENHDHGTLKVLVTSIDGNFSHPFKSSDTVGQVHEQAYKKIIQDENATPFSSTSIEFKSVAQNDATPLSSFAASGEKRGSEADIVFSLTWVTQGG
jgi:hypothetical protein